MDLSAEAISEAIYTSWSVAQMRGDIWKEVRDEISGMQSMLIFCADRSQPDVREARENLALLWSLALELDRA